LEARPFKALQRFFKVYVKGFRGASELRNQLMSTSSTDEVRKMLDEFTQQMASE
jgi:tRNA-dihydrouridine synthase